MIDRSTNIRAALKAKQRGFLLNPFRFGGGGGGGTDPFFSSVTLLMHGDGTPGDTATVDSSSYGRTITSAGAPLPTLSDAQVKFGPTSMAFTGSGNSAFTCAASAETLPGTGDYTIEFWIYPLSFSTSPYLVTNRGGGTGAGWYYTAGVGGALSFGIDGRGTFSAGGIVTDAWQHVAASRVSGTTRLFVGGSLFNTFADTTDFEGVGRPLAIGRDNSSGNNLNGFVDDLRLTMGVGRYTIAFTPPTAAFPNS